MGGKNKQTQTTVVDPKVQGLQMDNYAGARAKIDTPTTSYGGLLSAGGNSSLMDATGAARGLLDFNAPQISASTYDPTQINRSSVRDLTTGPASAEAIRGYYDPFQQDVITNFQADNERQRQMAIDAGQARATAAGSFGGTRHGVDDALTNEAAFRSGNSFTAGLRSTGFQTALQAAQADQARRLQADQANQGIDYGVAGQNAGFLNSAGQFNAGQRQGADMANQGASISSAGVRTGAAGLLGNFGQQQQQQEQQALDAAYNEWLRQQQDPFVKQGLLNQSLGAISVPQTTTTTSPKGGLFNSGVKVGWSYKDGLSVGSA